MAATVSAESSCPKVENISTQTDPSLDSCSSSTKNACIKTASLGVMFFCRFLSVAIPAAILFETQCSCNKSNPNYSTNLLTTGITTSIAGLSAAFFAAIAQQLLE